jgi:gliding motility-associated lipoprotein GldB
MPLPSGLNYRETMRNLAIFFLSLMALASCNNKSKVEKAVEEIPVEVKITRFDKLFFESKPQELGTLKAQYPDLFPKQYADTIWTNKIQNPQWRELYGEVQKKYSNLGALEPQFAELFKHIKYYYPTAKVPKVFTLIGDMDYNYKGIYNDDIVLIPLELYLGKDHKYYKGEFPDYIKQNFEENQIIPDLVSSFATQKIAYPTDKSLISLMVYAGKELYLKDKLLPETPDEVKIGYSKPQIDWCFANESYIWSYFIEQNLLYEKDTKLAGRFIAPAPFSKFYLEIDNESPGRVGVWIGWQIVRSYMENNEISLQDMLKMDAKTIFENSKYKPRK